MNTKPPRAVIVSCAWPVRGNSSRSPNTRRGCSALVGVNARPPRLSQPALETLAIIAYRQPITRAEVEQIRGVNVDTTMQTLMERGLVKAVGRAEVVGRPPTYGTTALFLEYFGLRGLGDLPAADELRRITIEKPPAPGLATTPPEPLKAEGRSEKAEKHRPLHLSAGDSTFRPMINDLILPSEFCILPSL